MIIVAMVLSAIISHWEVFFIILALLLLNAIVGFYQERKAGISGECPSHDAPRCGNRAK